MGPIIGHGVCVVGSMVAIIGTVEGVESSAGMFLLIGTYSDSGGVIAMTSGMTVGS